MLFFFLFPFMVTAIAHDVYDALTLLLLLLLLLLLAAAAAVVRADAPRADAERQARRAERGPVRGAVAAHAGGAVPLAAGPARRMLVVDGSFF